MLLLLATACSSPSGDAPRQAASTRQTAATAPASLRAAPEPARRSSGVVDTAWIDTLTGWALSTGSLAKTSDGGRSWTALPAPVRASHLRFADGQTGYAFGPALSLTTDGGRSWTEQPGVQVAALELAGTRAVRVVTDNPACTPPGCRYVVEQGAVGASTWRRPEAPALEGVAAALVVDGLRIYAAALGNPAGGASSAHAMLARSTDGGSSWKAFADPCRSGPEGEVDTRSMAAAADGFLAVLCVSRRSQTSYLLTSTDAGTTFGPPRPLPPGAQQVAAGTARVIAVSFVNGVTRGLLVSADAGETWPRRLEMPTPDGPQLSWSLTFHGPDVAQASFGGASIWTTTDGGLTWTERQVG